MLVGGALHSYEEGLDPAAELWTSIFIRNVRHIESIHAYGVYGIFSTCRKHFHRNHDSKHIMHVEGVRYTHEEGLDIVAVLWERILSRSGSNMSSFGSISVKVPISTYSQRCHLNHDSKHIMHVEGVR